MKWLLLSGAGYFGLATLRKLDSDRQAQALAELLDLGVGKSADLESVRGFTWRETLSDPRYVLLGRKSGS